jgi:hypothetical protein
MPLSYINPELFDAQPLSGGGYKYTLASRLGTMMLMIEEMFGERDPSYTILGVEFGGDIPMIWYPGNRRHVAIRLTTSAASYPQQACYQLAHEAVHLLAPSGGKNANNFEEGVATYFSAFYMRAFFPNYPNTVDVQSYARAVDLVSPRLKSDAYCIRRLRTKQPSFSLITPEDLTVEFPDLKSTEVEFLLSKFVRDPVKIPEQSSNNPDGSTATKPI